MSPLLASVLAGAAAALAGYAFLDVFFGEQRRVQRRLEQLSEFEARSAVEAEPVLGPFSERVLRPAARRLSTAVSALAPRAYLQRLKRRLDLAGMSDVDPEAVLALKVLPAIAAAAVVVASTAVTGRGAGRAIAGASLLAALAFFAPDLVLRQRRAARQKAIRLALPDLLDMLTISVEAGLGFDAALAKLVQNSSGPLAEEFARMLAEIQAGLPRPEAFRRLSERAGVPEVAAFASSIVQADVFGVSIAGVLRTQARELRTRRRQKAEEQAQKAPVKMVFPLVLCILPVTLIIILGPAIISIGRAFGIGG
ncbi:MAG: type II secretion system F family protein [Coriobacteriia bacterium]|nr:type II secretion system F family protein [Coriobacteriia bacterium]